MKIIHYNIEELLAPDMKAIRENALALELIIRAVGDPETAAALSELQSEIRYMNPSVERNVAAYQEKIAGRIGDMRIAVTKIKKGGGKTLQPLIEDVQYIIAERNSKA
jgi:oxalate decarboxylase/phosphoglucose isomerase-like protein (cupin superfamily)